MKLKQISPNLHVLEARDIVYFSYETPIAFYEPIEDKLIVSENIWSRATANHISAIKMLYLSEQIITLPHDDFVFHLLDYTS